MSDTQETSAQAPVKGKKKSNQESRPGSVSPVTMMTVYLCAAIGGTITAIADIVQKEQASAVLKMTSVSARHLDLAVPPLYVFAIVVVLGVLLCFVFQPNNRRAGFAVGAGVIASIMTVTPYQPLKSGLPTAPDSSQEDSFNQPTNKTIQLASSDFGGLMLAMDIVDLAIVPVKNDLAIPVEVKVSFFDRNARRPYEQVQAIAAGQTAVFEFSAKAAKGQVNGELFIQVGGERSSYVSVSGSGPYRSNTLLLTKAVPSFAQSQINKEALNSYSTTTTRAPRPASDSEVRQIYNKPTGFFNSLQQKLLTPKKW